MTRQARDESTGIAGPSRVELLHVRKDQVAGEMSLGPPDGLDPASTMTGAIASLATELARRGAQLHVGPGRQVATIEIKTNLLRPSTATTMTAEAVPLAVSDTTLVWQVTVREGPGIQVAIVLLTQLVTPADPVRPPPAAGATPSTRPRTTAAGRQRRDDLLEAACAIIAHKGFANASMREIAAAAGMSVPTMYQHVGSKDELLELIFLISLDDVRREVAAADPGGGSATERLRALVTATLAAFDRNRKRFALMTRESRSLSPEARHRVFAGYSSYVTVFAKVLADGAAQGEFRAVDPELAADLIDCLCDVWTLRYFAVGKYGLDTVRGEILALLANGLAARQPGAASPGG